MSKLNITGTRSHLKPWAMELAVKHARARNVEIARHNEQVTMGDKEGELEDMIVIGDLFHSGGRDDGTFVVWEVQDGSGWIITVCADFTTGKVEVEG